MSNIEEKGFQNAFEKHIFCSLPMRIYILLSLTIFIFSTESSGSDSDQEKLFPADSGIINVKTVYGAKGDAVTDDTQAILKAVRENVGRDRILYFPKGTYLVSDRLDWRNSQGAWKPYLTLQGQSKKTTTIKLKDNCPGYKDPNTPKAVIYTASIGSEAGNRAHKNSICDLTIDTGSANPGAIGIDYLANNLGAIRNVTIQSGDSQGKIGLSLARNWPGPCLIKNVGIEGFEYGISTGSTWIHCITLEHISLKDQSVAGIFNKYNNLSIRNLNSINSVPVIQNFYAGLITLIDGNFTGGRTSNSAIENKGSFYGRNITTKGYLSAIRDKGSIVPGSAITEFVSDSVLSLFPSPKKSLNLPIRETPIFHDNDFSHWANVEDFGANGTDNEDDTCAIQAAIDSGRPIIYFPSGRYFVKDTIHVRGNVKKIFGMKSIIYPSWGNAFIDPEHPATVFRFDKKNRDVVFLENLHFSIRTAPDSGAIWVEHASPSALVLKDAAIPLYQNTENSGPLFAENVIMNCNFHHPQEIWARQLDAEGRFAKKQNARIVNTGGRLWVLGIKSEGAKTLIETNGGGQTEVLGGLLYPGVSVPKDVPAFVNNESNLSLIYYVSAPVSRDTNYDIHVKEIRNQEIRLLRRTDVPSIRHASIVNLFTGFGDYRSSITLSPSLRIQKINGRLVDGNGKAK